MRRAVEPLVVSEMQVRQWLRLPGSKVMDSCFDSAVCKAFEENVQVGVPEEWIKSVRAALAQAFKVAVSESPGYQWQKILQGANDCEADILPGWLSSPFPLANIDHSFGYFSIDIRRYRII